MTVDQAHIVQRSNARSLRAKARRFVVIVLGVAALLTLAAQEVSAQMSREDAGDMVFTALYPSPERQ